MAYTPPTPSPPPPPPPPPQEQLVFITVTFAGVSGDPSNSITAMVRNIGTADITIIMWKLGFGGTAVDIPDVTIAPGAYANVVCANVGWTSGTTYDIILITSYGNHFYYRTTVDGGVEWLEIFDATFSGTSGDVANTITLSVRNVGTKDVTVVKYKLGYFGTAVDITGVVVDQGSTASVVCANAGWTSGTTYEIYLYTSTGKKFSYAATAP